MKLKNNIKDIVYGANDGIITTFAVIAGITGASLDSKAILIIGFASLFADAFSMASSNYLGTKSEHEVMVKGHEDFGPERHHPVGSAVTTFIAFVIAGSIPMMPYLVIESGDIFRYAILATGVALFLVGSLRTLITGRNFIKSGLEMLFVGGIAAIIAFFVGWFIKTLVG